jgi:hypothetical protein
VLVPTKFVRGRTAALLAGAIPEEEG